MFIYVSDQRVPFIHMFSCISDQRVHRMKNHVIINDELDFLISIIRGSDV
jgi:hypothetical protein